MLLWQIYELLFRSDLPNIIQVVSAVSIPAALYGLYRRFNCHDPKCWRIGRYPSTDGKGWHYCRHHHNDNGVHL